MVFQAYALFPHMRVWENVAYPLRVRDISLDERRRRAGEMLDLVGLSGLADRLPALRHSILAGLIIVAALSIGEFQLSNLVAGFLNRTYPIVLLQAFYGATGFACAATVILLALALAAAVGGSVAAGGATRLKAAAA